MESFCTTQNSCVLTTQAGLLSTNQEAKSLEIKYSPRMYNLLCMNYNQPANSSSSSVGPVANATDVLQPSRLIVLNISPSYLDVTTFAARYLHVHDDARDPSSEKWNCVGENWPVIFPEITTSTSIQGSLHATNLWHGTHSFTSLPKEGVLRIFSPCKILTASAGFEPMNLGT